MPDSNAILQEILNNEEPDLTDSPEEEKERSIELEASYNDTITFLKTIENTEVDFFSNLSEDPEVAYTVCRDRLYQGLSRGMDDTIPKIADDDYADRLFCSRILDYLLDYDENNHVDKGELALVEMRACDITNTIDNYMKVINKTIFSEEKKEIEKRILGVLLLKTADYTDMAQTLITNILVPLNIKVEEVDSTYKEAKKAADTAKTTAVKAKKAAKIANKSLKGNIGQIIAILTIFTAIAFTLVGGTSSLGDLLSSKTADIHIMGPIIVYWLMAMILVITIMFCYVYAILKGLNTYDIEDDDETKVTKKKGIGYGLLKASPIIFVFVITAVALIVLYKISLNF